MSLMSLMCCKYVIKLITGLNLVAYRPNQRYAELLGFVNNSERKEHR